MRAGLQDARELAEAQHDTALLFGDEDEGVEGEPQDRDHRDPAADPAAAGAEETAQRVEEAVESSAAAAALPRIAAVLVR